MERCEKLFIESLEAYIDKEHQESMNSLARATCDEEKDYYSTRQKLALNIKIKFHELKSRYRIQY